MDIITQGLLGASTFGVIKNRDIGSRSMLIGAIAGISPDFDFLLAPFYSEVEHLIIHRSFSHSLILAAIISPILGEIFHRVYENENTRSSWYLAFFLAISTHSLLDLCTTYGTKLLSPISDHIFSTNNIHVFEPFYTLILLLGVIFALRKGKSNIRRKRHRQL